MMSTQSFKLSDLAGKKVVIHCPTEKQAKLVLEILHRSGWRWKTHSIVGRSSLRDNTLYSVNNNKTCYTLEYNPCLKVGTISYYKSIKYTVISAWIFIEANWVYPDSEGVTLEKSPIAQELIDTVQILQKRLEQLINLTPTSEERNKMTDDNTAALAILEKVGVEPLI